MCVMESLEDNYNLYVDESKETLMCMNNQIPVDILKRVTVDCPEVNAKIDKYNNLISFEVPPFCVEQKRFFPDSRFRLETCIKEVKSYLETMKRNINDETWGLRQDVDNVANEAVRKFNCYADGGTHCY